MPYTIEDFSLDDLEKNMFLSASAIYTCKKNQLTGLKDIITVYRKYGSFIYLNNTNRKTKKELSELCKKYSAYSFEKILKDFKENSDLKKRVENLTSGQIGLANKQIEYLTLKLSVRARNGLQSIFNRTPNIIELTEKINLPNFSFSNIRNIGTKTVQELDNFMSEVIIFIKNIEVIDSNTNNHNDILQPKINDDYDEYIVKTYNLLSPFKKAALNRHIEYLNSKLSIRSRNGINTLFCENANTKELIETIFNFSFNFQEIKNIGDKSVSELNEFKINISNFIEKLKHIEDTNLSREYVNLIIKTTFSNLQPNFDQQFETIFDGTGRIKIFKLIHILIEDHHLLNNKEQQIFNFLYKEGYDKTIEQISKELNLGKERLRQLRIIFENQANNHFRFILGLNRQDLVDYEIYTDEPFMVIDSNIVKNINYSENVNFNFLFYSLIFGLLYENSHSILGDNERISGKGNYTNSIRYKNCYLIENQIFHSFSFMEFSYEIHTNLAQRIVETYSLHFEGYLIQFLKPNSRKYLSSIKEMCEVILFKEFDLVINNEGYIQFERNIRKTLPQYTYEALKEFGKMTKVEEIVNAINDKYPGLSITDQSVRSTLQRDKDLYIYIGRTSTYGLKEWENEHKNLKGGTIRDIAEEYLEKLDSPQHIYDIVKYVKQYRDTKGESIFSNLQAEEKNRFVFYKGKFIGLKSKSYDPTLINFKRVVGTNFRSDILKKFDGWDYNELVNYYVQTFKYTASQVVNLFESKIQNGEIILNDDNTISI